MYILGLNCYAHDSAACIIKDGELIAFCEEERFVREKHTGLFPFNALNFCLKTAGITINEIDYIGFYLIPKLIYNRIMYISTEYYPKSCLYFPVKVTELAEFLIKLRRDTKRVGIDIKKIIFLDHHETHAASCFFLSHFDKAAILTVDGKGEWTTTGFYIGEGNKIKLLKEVKFPHSVGYLYSIITKYLGFKPWGGEGKVMGLAPYGEPTYYDYFKKLIKKKNDGTFELNLDILNYHLGLPWISAKLIKDLGKPREPESELTKRYEDIAASLQLITEEVLIHMVNYLYEVTKLKNLCLAGGVALNSVANGRILKETPFEEIFIQPAANDAGCSLGCCYYIYHQILNKERNFVMNHVFWGPEFSNEEIEKKLKEYNLSYEYYDDITKPVAKLLSEGKIVGWFQGKMEIGPRALGNRSILADARIKDMKDILNKRVKRREPFRPYAPSVLEEYTKDYFEIDYPSPFMLLVYKVKKEKQNEIPAVVHVDETGRLQTVNEETNPLYYKLIKEFYKLTGTPVILNTSFNVRGEPIVCRPKEAINDFINTEMDYLAIGNFLVKK